MKKIAKQFILLLSVLIVTIGTMRAQDKTLITFNNDKPGELPKGWTNVFGQWTVKEDGQNQAMAQTAQNRDMDFNVAVLNETILKDVELSVDIRAISGDEDQGGGLVWRYKDERNYYIVRFNPLENNFRLYKVLDGHRKQLASAKASMVKGKWFSLKVVMTGNEIKCFLGEKQLLSKTDDTFTAAGKIGFWTKADAVSDFDNFSVKGK
jgi:hypothetical protein